jgi:hypothetical protein
MDSKKIQQQLDQDNMRADCENLAYVIKRIQYCKAKYKETGKEKFLEWCAFLYQEERRLKDLLKIK